MKYNSIDFRYLKAFYLTANYKSFSKAASELNIAQSAISRQIKLLEESLNEELMIRSSKQVLLTEKGSKLFQATIQFNSMLKFLNTEDQQQTIRVGIIHGLLENWFINILSTYYKEYEHNVEVFVHNLRELKTLLEEGKLDIIITTQNIQTDIISSLKLFDEQLGIISNSRIAHSEISQYTWLVYNREDMIFQITEQRPQKIQLVNSMTAIVNLVQRGLGIALVPKHLIYKLENIYFLPLEGQNQSQIFLATLNYKSMPIHFKEIIQIIVNQKNWCDL